MLPAGDVAALAADVDRVVVQAKMAEMVETAVTGETEEMG